MKIAGSLCVLAAVALLGCGGSTAAPLLDSYQPATVETEAQAKTWASVSAPMVYVQASMPLASIGLATQLPADASSSFDPDCPKRTQSGNTLTVEGGCTDKNGVKWFGKAVQNSEAAGSTTGRFTYQDFGMERSETCQGNTVTSKATFNGVLDVSGTQQETRFDVDTKAEGTDLDESTCAVKTLSAAWDYQGTIQRDGNATTWNGSGRMGSSELGVVSAETKDEVLNPSTCANEASSGTTTIKAGSNIVVITYDGATKCDDNSTAKWSLNGADKGELTGVACSAASGPATVGASLMVLAALALVRRRFR
ncbi:MAG: hypothetical protein ACOZIN_02510 [Myxococcota bacterium]